MHDTGQVVGQITSFERIRGTVPLLECCLKKNTLKCLALLQRAWHMMHVGNLVSRKVSSDHTHDNFEYDRYAIVYGNTLTWSTRVDKRTVMVVRQ